MKQITILFIAFTFASLTLKSQATFQSIKSGNWSSPTTWTLTAGTSATWIPKVVLMMQQSLQDTRLLLISALFPPNINHSIQCSFIRQR
jgi:hypothetical protein